MTEEYETQLEEQQTRVATLAAECEERLAAKDREHAKTTDAMEQMNAQVQTLTVRSQLLL